MYEYIMTTTIYYNDSRNIKCFESFKCAKTHNRLYGFNKLFFREKTPGLPTFGREGNLRHELEGDERHPIPDPRFIMQCLLYCNVLPVVIPRTLKRGSEENGRCRATGEERKNGKE